MPVYIIREESVYVVHNMKNILVIISGGFKGGGGGGGYGGYVAVLQKNKKIKIQASVLKIYEYSIF